MRSLALAALASGLTAGPASADVVFYSSTAGNPNPSSNAKDENEFRNALPGAPSFNQPGNEGTWRNDWSRTVNWEDETVPVLSLDPFASPGTLPADFYNTTVREGLVLSTPGTGFTVSQDDNTGADADPDLLGFKNVDPAYSFPVLTAQRLMAPLGSKVVDFRFFKPGTDVPATVTAFGLELSDVDLGGSTFEAFDEQGVSLNNGPKAIPVKTQAGVSFAGVTTTTERIARVRVDLGTDPLGAPDSGLQDVVAIDDVFYSEPWRGLPALSLAASSFAASEGDATAKIIVRRNGEAAGSATVTYVTTDGTAKSGQDYTGSSGSVTFGPDEAAKTISIPVAADGVAEAPETFDVRLTGAQGGALVTPTSATVTITDAAAAPGGQTTVTTPGATTTVTTPAPPPTPAPTTPPTVSLTGLPATLKLAALRKGVSVKVTTNEPASIDGTLQTTARKATIAAAFNLALAQRSLAVGTGTRVLKLVPDARLLGRARRFKVQVAVVATDRSGNRRRVAKTVSVR